MYVCLLSMADVLTVLRGECQPIADAVRGFFAVGQFAVRKYVRFG